MEARVSECSFERQASARKFDASTDSVYVRTCVRARRPLHSFWTTSAARPLTPKGSLALGGSCTAAAPPLATMPNTSPGARASRGGSARSSTREPRRTAAASPACACGTPEPRRTASTACVCGAPASPALSCFASPACMLRPNGCGSRGSDPPTSPWTAGTSAGEVRNCEIAPLRMLRTRNSSLRSETRTCSLRTSSHASSCARNSCRWKWCVRTRRWTSARTMASRVRCFTVTLRKVLRHHVSRAPSAALLMPSPAIR
mmetsp:Transcript_34716/g.86617  ORF Transcript_34716/g.86617 Transcript_34716/m.86617 type:complete len:259 (+) Transcript_34716:695-1471(+)